ncbi:MAG: hypothetical protein KGD73_10950 [Candidatus Lokiarchaeota archaeon]|nr:hypothetical protein [Candidatus Lokiarchaeota archaeon]
MKIFEKIKNKKSRSLEEAIRIHEIDRNSNIRQRSSDFSYTPCGHHQAYLNKTKRG